MGFRRKSRGQAPGSTPRVARLRAQIDESKQLRPLVQDPDLSAVRMSGTRRNTVRCLWLFLALGLVFTTAGVQRFLAAGATPHDPLWWAAWTVEPMFAGLLITLLNFESVILSHGIEPDHPWWTRLKRVLLGSTLFMNVVPQLTAETFNMGSLAVHLIIPIIVFGLAEVLPVIEARSHQVIRQGYDLAAQAESSPTEPATPEPEPEPAPTPEPVPAPEPVSEPAPPTPETPSQPPTPAAAIKRGPKLPAPMVEAISQRRAEAASEGRELTAADIQQVAKLPDALVEQVLADLATNNGHALT